MLRCALERRLVGRDYILDGGFSAADIGIGQALYMARHFARTDDFPALGAWYARVTARKGFRNAAAGNRPTCFINATSTRHGMAEFVRNR
ncbi:MAG: glutathione binding-like protein [Defluviimonas denitrificans]